MIRRQWQRSIVLVLATAVAYLLTAGVIAKSVEVRPHLVLPTGGPDCSPAAFSPDGRYFVGTSYRLTNRSAVLDFTIHVWETATGRKVASRSWGTDDTDDAQLGLPRI